jgi:hypothetical protein
MAWHVSEIESNQQAGRLGQDRTFARWDAGWRFAEHWGYMLRNGTRTLMADLLR